MSGQSRFLQSTSLSQPCRARRRGRLVTLTGLVVATLAVAGCGGNQTVQEMIGYDRSVPDEFAVMPRAPLAMPASMDELPPPTPGAPRPQEAQPREQAEAILFGQGQRVTRSDAPAAVGPGASSILAKAGQAEPGIRTTVDTETAERAQSEDGLVDRLMFWQDKPLPGTVVDPYKESARLNTNAEEGKPLTTGDTPIIIRRRKAPLEGLVPSF
ncbi:DUF3035 domain-containing protein [Inquilinus limosus]|uniref:DUF3035 domain-containing protein n=1 Tax=Inquilinus limosus TaxID=171674 RepID=UPI003F17061C